MWFLVIGVVLLLMKWLAFGPVAGWSWWVVLSPFILALIWFEGVEPFLGLDKKRAHDDVDKAKKERLAKQMEDNRPRR